MNTFLNQLRIRATKGTLRTIIFPEAQDERVLEAAKVLAREKIASPLLICSHKDSPRVRELGLDCVEMEEGRASELKKLLLQLRSSKVGTTDELTLELASDLSHDPLFYALYLLHLGEGDGLVAGASRTTAEVVRAGLWLVGKAEGIQTVSSSMYMVIPAFRGGDADEVLTFSDCAVVPHPTADQLADIAIAAADARGAIVGDVPRVALLSYSTKGSGGNSQSIATIRTALELVRERRPGLVIDGELQADAALVQSISQRKAPGNLIAGRANVLIFPSLDAANIAYKLVASLAPNVQAFGPILQGMAKPMSDLSRGVRSDEIVRIATIIASQATRRE